ncbi:MAG: MBL fold metallo-hydrolase [Candidatus Aenigmatarchaeota archaeon]
MKVAWGFSCLIEGLEKKILFDTGGDGKILIKNMENLGINPKDIKLIFLSHNHWDHIGGLMDFLNKNPNVVIYLLSSFPEEIKNSIKNKNAKFIEIKKPIYICEKVGTTGQLGTFIKEESLVIETKKGLVIITGCAHPKIVHIIKFVKDYFKKDIYLAIGGFHLKGFSDNELKKIIQQFRKLGVKKVGPCHCSGERCRELFKDEYQKDYIEIGVGKIINVE